MSSVPKWMQSNHTNNTTIINSSSSFIFVQAQTSTYRFTSEFTRNILLTVNESISGSSQQDVHSLFDHSSELQLDLEQNSTQPNSTISITTTICFASIDYDHQKNTLSWKFIFDEPLVEWTSNQISLFSNYYYFRLIHSNLLNTRFSSELFLPNLGQDLLREYPVSTLQNKNGMDLNYDKMIFHLNGSSINKSYFNISKYLDIPELFENEYYIQWFTLRFNRSQILNQLERAYSNNRTEMQQNEMYLLLTSIHPSPKNVKFSFSSLMTFNSSIQVLSLVTSNIPLINTCGTKSPVVAFAWNSWRLWFVLGMALLMLIVLVSSIWRPYFVVLLTLVIFQLAGILSLNDALSGFSNSGTLIVALLFPIVKPLSENSLVLKFSGLLFGSPIRFKTNNKKNAFLNHLSLVLPTLRIGLVFTLFSAFVSNTPVVATGIPLILEWAKQHRLASSKFLMTLLYTTVGGGLLTYIGTSASIVANGIYTQFGYSSLTFYEFIYVGSILACFTIIYCSLYVLWISPKEGVKPKLNTSTLSSIIGFSDLSTKKAIPKVRERSELFVSLVKMSHLESQPKRSKAYRLFTTMNGSSKEKILQKLELGKHFDLEAILREELRTKEEIGETSSIPSTSSYRVDESPQVSDPSKDKANNTFETHSTTIEPTCDSVCSQNDLSKIPPKEEHSQQERVSGISFLRHISPVPLSEIVQKNDILIFRGLSDSIFKLHSMMVECKEKEETFQKTDHEIHQQVSGDTRVGLSSNPQESIDSTVVLTTTSRNGASSSHPEPLLMPSSNNLPTQILEVPYCEEGRNSQSSSNGNLNSYHSTDLLIESPTTLSDSSFHSHPNNTVTNQLYLNLKKKNVVDAGEKKPSLESPPQHQHHPSTSSTLNTPTTPRKRFSLKFHREHPSSDETHKDGLNELEFFEVVVGPSNSCVGQLYESFERRFQVKVLAIRQLNSSTTLISDERTVKNPQPEKTTIWTKTDHDLTLQTVSVGDTILILGKTRFYRIHHDSSRDFYVISRMSHVSPYHDPFSSKKVVWTIPCTHKTLNLWWWEHWIFVFFLAMISCAIAGFPMVQCTLVTFCVIILFGLISPTKAVDCIEWRLVVMVGASFGIANAITQSGVAEALTEILRWMNMPLLLLPACLVLITLCITSIITNNAAVAICLPLGLAVARAYGLNPRCMAMCVTYAASSVFATPIGYQANMLIMVREVIPLWII